MRSPDSVKDQEADNGSEKAPDGRQIQSEEDDRYNERQANDDAEDIGSFYTGNKEWNQRRDEIRCDPCYS